MAGCACDLSASQASYGWSKEGRLLSALCARAVQLVLFKLVLSTLCCVILCSAWLAQPCLADAEGTAEAGVRAAIAAHLCVAGGALIGAPKEAKLGLAGAAGGVVVHGGPGVLV